MTAWKGMTCAAGCQCPSRDNPLSERNQQEDEALEETRKVGSFNNKVLSWGAGRPIHARQKALIGKSVPRAQMGKRCSVNIEMASSKDLAISKMDGVLQRNEGQ